MEEHRIYSIKHGTWWKKKMPVNVNQNPIRITRRLFEDYKKKNSIQLGKLHHILSQQKSEISKLETPFCFA